MIKAIILLGMVFINTDMHAVTSTDVSGSLELLPHSRQVVAQGVQPQAKNWFSLSPLEKMNRVRAHHLQEIDVPKYRYGNGGIEPFYTSDSSIREELTTQLLMSWHGALYVSCILYPITYWVVHLMVSPLGEDLC